MYEIDGFAEWEASAPESLTGDPLWRMRLYRLSLFVATRVWADADVLSKTSCGAKVADQLTRAVGSIGANVAEGYSRDSGRDRGRLFGYALGSARESLHWYRMAADTLAADRLRIQIATLDQIRRMLIAVIPRERTRHMK